VFAWLFGGGLKNLAQVEQKADRIVVVKSEHRMTLLSGGRVLKTYRVALGRGSAGEKERMGDNKTPKRVCNRPKERKQPLSSGVAHLVSERGDKERAKVAGVDPGGAIMIHGLENGLGGWVPFSMTRIGPRVALL